MKGRIDTDKAREFAIKRKGQAIEKAKSGNSQKTPVFIKELNMTVYVLPGADIPAIIKKHKEMKDWRRKTLHH